VDYASWVVDQDLPDERACCGRTPEQTLTWTLVWLMAPELGIGHF
jgi:hypothetical protein